MGQSQGLITSGRRLMTFYILLSVLLLTGSICKGEDGPGGEGPKGEGPGEEGPGGEGSDGEGPGGKDQKGEGPGPIEDGKREQIYPPIVEIPAFPSIPNKAIEEKIHNINAYFSRIKKQYIEWSASQAIKENNRRRMRRMRRHRRH